LLPILGSPAFVITLFTAHAHASTPPSGPLEVLEPAQRKEVKSSLFVVGCLPRVPFFRTPHRSDTRRRHSLLTPVRRWRLRNRSLHTPRCGDARRRPEVMRHGEGWRRAAKQRAHCADSSNHDDQSSNGSRSSKILRYVGTTAMKEPPIPARFGSRTPVEHTHRFHPPAKAVNARIKNIRLPLLHSRVPCPRENPLLVVEW